MAILSAIDTRLELRRADEAVSKKRKLLVQHKLAVAEITGALNSIPDEFSDLLDTVQAVGYGGNLDEDQNTATLDSIIAEYAPLRDAANGLVVWTAANVTEF